MRHHVLLLALASTVACSGATTSEDAAQSDDVGVGDSGFDASTMDAFTIDDATPADVTSPSDSFVQPVDAGPDAAVLHCPTSGTLPDGRPYQDYTLNADDYLASPATNYTWHVTSHDPCAEMYAGTSATPTFTITGDTTSMVTFRPVLSGAYTVRLDVRLADASVADCSFDVRVASPGLHVELCWDTAATTNLDLHLHRSGTTTAWFGTVTTPSRGDCFRATCIPMSSSVRADWGYADSPLASCQNTPTGARWTSINTCWNPRLDVSAGAMPNALENIFLDDPQDADRFRVMVHYSVGSVVTHPAVVVYCDGAQVAAQGFDPQLVPGFDSTPGGWDTGPMWRVGDVTTHVAADGTTTCDMEPLHAPGSATGYWVMPNDTSY